MPRVTLKVRNNPWDILKNMEKFNKPKKLDLNPVVSAAITSVPPTPLSLRSAVPQEIGAFIPAENHYQKKPNTTNSNSYSSPNLLQRFQRPKKINKNKPQLYIKPFDIVYPEDEMRKEFYENHPYELRRPLFLVESEDSLKERQWSTIEQDGVSLSGESVIKRAMYLMSAKGGNLSREKAYRQSVQEFYQSAAKEEAHQEQIKKKIIDEYNFDRDPEHQSSYTPFADRFIQAETKALEETIAYHQEVVERRISGIAAQEQLSLASLVGKQI